MLVRICGLRVKFVGLSSSWREFVVLVSDMGGFHPRPATPVFKAETKMGSAVWGL